MKTHDAGDLPGDNPVKAAERALHATASLPPSAATKRLQVEAWRVLRQTRERFATNPKGLHQGGGA